MSHGLAGKIIDNDSVDITPRRGGVDELLRCLSVCLVGKRVAQSRLQNSGEAAHSYAQLALNIFLVLLNAQIAVHRHRKDDHSDQGNDEFGSKVHLD